MCRSLVRCTDAADDLVFLRLRTLAREVMVVPGDEFLLVAIQAAGVDEAG